MAAKLQKVALTGEGKTITIAAKSGADQRRLVLNADDLPFLIRYLQNIGEEIARRDKGVIEVGGEFAARVVPVQWWQLGEHEESGDVVLTLQIGPGDTLGYRLAPGPALEIGQLLVKNLAGKIPRGSGGAGTPH